MPGDSNLPSRNPASGLDRGALERVLARAAELQAGSGEPEEVLSEEQILELGKEVGLSAEHLRQALAEERTRVVLPADDGGLSAKLLGGARVGASRTVPGRPRDVLEAIDLWMQRQECLQVKRQFADRIVWEARRDLLGTVRRALNVGGRGYALARAHEVAATVVAVDGSRTLVRIDADLASFRSSLARQSAGVTVVGVAAGSVLAALHFAIAVAVAPPALIGVGAFYLARGINARTATSAQLALEQLLDGLERGDVTKPQPSILSALAAAAAAIPRKY
ncbi:MAG TPA: hypothetical protein VH080_01680 [Gemmatimonadaceae bacterium]|jgi:hypothetical protein|nr:hypothetical protein [Gemmatimonadaceae bacterium]